MSWIDDNKSEIAEAEWEGLDNKRSTRDSPKAWKLEEYREYSDLSHRKYALRNGLNPDEQVRYNKLSLHFEMFDNRHLVFDAYDTLKAKHERVLQALKEASKRSTYEWTDGYDYFPSDHANEGRIALANELITIIEAHNERLEK